MATNRIVLLITDEQIVALNNVIGLLADLTDTTDSSEFPEEVDGYNDLYKVLDDLRESAEREVLAS